MEKLRNFGTRLGKDDQIKIFGGVVPPTGILKLVGTRYYQGNCFCDYSNSDGSWEVCSVPCDICNCVPLSNT